jgi:hypothetical protein
MKLIIKIMKTRLFLFMLIATLITVVESGSAKAATNIKNQTYLAKGMGKLLASKNRNHEPEANRIGDIRQTSTLCKGNQSDLRSIVFQSFDEQNQIWKNDFRQMFVFINDTLEKEIYTDFFDETDFFPYSKTVISYDEYWRESEQMVYMWEDFTETWQIFEKVITLYSSNGQITMNATLSWDDSAMRWDTIFGNRTDFVYNHLQLPIQQTSSYYDYFQSIWRPIDQFDFEYDFQGRCSAMTVKYWDDFVQTFMYEAKEEYSFNSNNEWEEVLIYGWNEEWITVSKITDLNWFNFEERQFSSYLKWDSDPWTPYVSWEMSYRGTYNYHPDLHVLASAYEEYFDIFDEVWVPSFRETNLFNESFMLIKTTQEVFEFDSWHIIFGQIFNGKFDQHGRPIEVETIVFDPDNSIWNKWMKLIFEFENITTIKVPVNKTEIAVVFPNPASQMFSVPVAENDLQITVYNIAGSLIFQDNIYSNEVSVRNIDITSWPNGLYIVKVMGKNIDKVAKLIKN